MRDEIVFDGRRVEFPKTQPRLLQKGNEMRQDVYTFYKKGVCKHNCIVLVSAILTEIGAEYPQFSLVDYVQCSTMFSTAESWSFLKAGAIQKVPAH